MKKHAVLPLLAVAGGAAAFGLRLWQNRSAFEPDTGLPVPGAPAALILAGFLLLLAILLALLARRLPRETGNSPVFPAGFVCADARLLAVPVAGILLMAAAGLADLYEGFGMGSLMGRLQAAASPYAFPAEEARGFAPRAQVLLGGLSLLSAAALLPAASACRYRGNRSSAASPVSSFSGSLLLAPPVALVIRLVLTYRLDSVNPALEAYYVELLALVLLTLGFYRLSSFAFGAGRTWLYALYACAATALCCCTLADGGPYLSSLLLYAGGGITLLGFLLLRLSHVGEPAGDSVENTGADHTDPGEME